MYTGNPGTQTGKSPEQVRNKNPDPAPITSAATLSRDRICQTAYQHHTPSRFSGAGSPRRLTLLRVWTCCSNQPPKIKVSRLFRLSDVQNPYLYDEALIVNVIRSNKPKHPYTVPNIQNDRSFKVESGWRIQRMTKGCKNSNTIIGQPTPTTQDPNYRNNLRKRVSPSEGKANC